MGRALFCAPFWAPWRCRNPLLAVGDEAANERTCPASPSRHDSGHPRLGRQQPLTSTITAERRCRLAADGSAEVRVDAVAATLILVLAQPRTGSACSRCRTPATPPGSPAPH